MKKCMAALRMLVYGKVVDVVDEYTEMGEGTCIEAMVKFTYTMIKVFGPEYLREQTIEDTKKLMDVEAERGFLGMLGSIDCIHWQWKTAQKVCVANTKITPNTPQIILEVVGSKDLWIWHGGFPQRHQCVSALYAVQETL